MEIKNFRDAFLSNYEVLNFMSKLQRKHQWAVEEDIDMTEDKKWKRKKQYNHPELQAITRDVVNYLSISKELDPEDSLASAGPPRSGITRMNDDSFTQLMKNLNKFKLYKIEKLQLVNQLPSNVVHLYSIIEECDSRFTEDELASMIDIIRKASQ